MEQQERIKVACRVRPMNASELKDKSEPVVETQGSNVYCKDAPTDKQRSKCYTFDWAFGQRTTQREFFDAVAAPVVNYVMEGYNATLFAYGQTSSGKTHTMEGNVDCPDGMGVIPRIVERIFETLATAQSSTFMLMVSYYEIYCEKICDLLATDPTKKLAVRCAKGGQGVVVQNLVQVYCSTLGEVMELMEDGKNNRHVAATNMNKQSSRSHALFQLVLKKEGKDVTTSKLTLVDLAGSEKIAKTGITDEDKIKEAKQINQSLTSLGMVINALAEGKKHVPYRDSVLTRILEDSLGGNSRTLVIICCSPSQYNLSEIRSTLQFGERAKKIKNKTKKNVERPMSEYKRLYEEEVKKTEQQQNFIDRLKKELAQWRSGTAVPMADQVDLTNAKTQQSGKGTSSSPRAASPGLTLSDSEVANEIKKMENIVDEKDAELVDRNNQLDEVKKEAEELKDKLLEKSQEAENVSREHEQLKLDFDVKKRELDEIIAALSELGEQVDQLNIALGRKEDDLGASEKTNNELRMQLESTKAITSVATESLESLKAKYSSMIQTVMTEVLAVAETVSGRKSDSELPVDNLEQLTSVARVHASKLKIDVQALSAANQRNETDVANQKSQLTELNDKILKLTCELNETKSRYVLVKADYDDIEKVKTDLDVLTDKQAVDLRKLKTENEVLQKKLSTKASSNTDMKKDLEDKFQLYASDYSAQVSDMRKKLQDKDADVKRIKALKYDDTSRLDALESENAALKMDLEETRNKLEQVTTQDEKREKARNELKGFEETLAKEMETLNRLRKMFVEDLRARMEKIATPGVDVGDLYDDLSVVHQQRLQFLQQSLEQTTTAHKQVIKENTELRCESTRLEKRLRSNQERCKLLETSVREAKVARLHEQKKHAGELEKMKESLARSVLGRRGGVRSNIMKPVGPQRTFVTTEEVVEEEEDQD